MNYLISIINSKNSPITVNGLTNDTTYTFKVVACNSTGKSDESGETAAATPKVTPPGAPNGVTAVGGDTKVTLNWTSVSGDNVCSPITGYVVTSVPGNITATGTGTTITVNGLTNGTTYSFIVKAINAVGNSLDSESSNVITPYQPSSGGSSEDTTPTSKTPIIEELTVDVKEGNTDSTVSRITIQRTTSEDNRITDRVTYSSEKVSETVKKLKEENKDTARIVIPDSKDEV